MPHTESKAKRVIEEIAVIGIAVPVLGLLMGGIYSWPVIHFCRGREPWLTGSLGLALGVTLFGFGALVDTPVAWTAAAWAVSLLLLLAARRLHGSLDGNLERFGMVHAVALTMAFALALAHRHGLLASA